MARVAHDVARRARYKLFGAVLTTYGYALAGAAIIEPLLKDGTAITPTRIWAFLFALALQGAAIYIAPKGEKP